MSYKINGTLPEGLVFDENTGIISGTPLTFETLGGISVTAIGTYGSTTSDIADIAIADTSPVFIGSISDIIVEEDSSIIPSDWSVYFLTGGAPTSYSLSGFPVGVNIDNNGIITGTPTVIGNYPTAKVTATNATGSDSTNEFNIEVTAEVFAPIFTGIIAAITEDIGTPVSIDVSGNFSTGDQPNTYFLTNAPSWMTISNGGVIEGTPDAVTNNSVTVTGQNQIGTAISNSFSVIGQMVAPVFDGTIANMTVKPGEEMALYDASTHYTTGGAIQSYSLQNAPTWMNISSAGIISGLPTIEEVVSGITVTGTNSTDSAISNAWEMDVSESVTTKMLTFDGTTSYGELAEPWVSTDGDWTAEIVFEGKVHGSSFIFITDGAAADSKRMSFLRKDAGDPAISFNTAAFSCTMDGVAVVDDVTVFPTDGKLHTIAMTGIAVAELGT